MGAVQRIRANFLERFEYGGVICSDDGLWNTRFGLRTTSDAVPLVELDGSPGDALNKVEWGAVINLTYDLNPPSAPSVVTGIAPATVTLLSLDDPNGVEITISGSNLAAGGCSPVLRFWRPPVDPVTGNDIPADDPVKIFPIAIIQATGTTFVARFMGEATDVPYANKAWRLFVATSGGTVNTQPILTTILPGL